MRKLILVLAVAIASLAVALPISRTLSQDVTCRGEVMEGTGTGLVGFSGFTLRGCTKDWERKVERKHGKAFANWQKSKARDASCVNVEGQFIDGKQVIKCSCKALPCR